MRKEVPVQISWIFIDNEASDCKIYADIKNNLKPFQQIVATNPDEVYDYSTWTLYRLLLF